MQEKYRELIIKLTNEFIQSIPADDIDKQNLISAFILYLNNIIVWVLESNPDQQVNYNKVERLLRRNSLDLIESDIDNKKAFLIQDEAFEKLRKLSLELSNFALNKKENQNIKITEEKYNEILMAFDRLYDIVKPYNKEEAENLRAEGILDANYLLNDNCEIISIRFGHIYK